MKLLITSNRDTIFFSFQSHIIPLFFCAIFAYLASASIFASMHSWDGPSLPIVITNKYKSADGYSGNLYDIDSATKNGIIYPSLDPSIFELKYPGTDIEGRVVGDY